jgi:hypothetical protein
MDWLNPNSRISAELQGHGKTQLNQEMWSKDLDISAC